MQIPPQLRGGVAPSVKEIENTWRTNGTIAGHAERKKASEEKENDYGFVIQVYTRVERPIANLSTSGSFPRFSFCFPAVQRVYKVEFYFSIGNKRAYFMRSRFSQMKNYFYISV